MCFSLFHWKKHGTVRVASRKTMQSQKMFKQFPGHKLWQPSHGKSSTCSWDLPGISPTNKKMGNRPAENLRLVFYMEACDLK